MTNEELADAQYQAKLDASTAAATEKALQDQLEQAKTEVHSCRIHALIHQSKAACSSLDFDKQQYADNVTCFIKTSSFSTARLISMAVSNLQFLNLKLKLFSYQQQKGAWVEQQWNGMQMQAVVAAAATKESALNEKRAALEARLQGNTAACAALETKVSAMT